MKIKSIIILLALASSLSQTKAQNWNQIDKVVASDRAADDFLGSSVAISGEYAIVGAENEKHDLSGANPANAAGAELIGIEHYQK
jgi:hypothetical protein